MRVQFLAREGVVCDAEVVFEEGTALAGMKLAGFTLRRSEEGLYVTFPARAYNEGETRKYLPYLRPTATDDPGRVVRRVKTWILEEYKKQGEPFKSV